MEMEMKIEINLEMEMIFYLICLNSILDEMNEFLIL